MYVYFLDNKTQNEFYNVFNGNKTEGNRQKIFYAQQFIPSDSKPFLNGAT